jgi:replicative DNA helicase Mcm
MSATTTPHENTELVDRFTEFFQTYHDNRDQETAERMLIPEYANAPNEHGPLEVDFEDVFQYNPDLAEDWLEHPDTVQDAAEEALRTYPLPVDISWEPSVHLVNLPSETKREIGKFDANADTSALRRVEGQVTKKTKKQPLLTEAVFVCQRCGAETSVPQGRTGYQEPYECESCERQGPFKLDPDKSSKVDHQQIRVQLPPEKAAGGSSEHLDVTLLDDVVESADVGDRVDITAKMSAIQPDENADKPLLEWYAEGEHVELEETDWEDLDIEKHKDRIHEIASSENPHEKLVQSVKPTHEGDEDIKLAIALQMFGGVRKELPDGSVVRGDSHMMFVGDPGTNKSGLLKYAKKIAPRSIYTSGKSSSGVGLTAAAVRDDFGGGGWTLEGGAMVRANKGTACIDEFDKMTEEDRGSMFEALAEQEISVSKAGINATLPARTRVLAAANPETGRFDQHAPIADQINLDPALISRFDLIFIVRDEVDEEKDARIAEMLNTTQEVGAKLARDEGVDSQQRDKVEPAIDEEVLRAYIAYARRKYTPSLSETAQERVREFYVNLRAKGANEDDPVPVTARKLQALHRLAEASARVRLSDTVTVEDVERVISLVRSCLEDIGIDPETGKFDADVVETGTSKSQRDRIQTVKSVIDELESETKRGAPIDGVIEMCVGEHQLMSEKVEHEIQRLKDQGDAYQPNEDHIRLV